MAPTSRVRQIQEPGARWLARPCPAGWARGKGLRGKGSKPGSWHAARGCARGRGLCPQRPPAEPPDGRGQHPPHRELTPAASRRECRSEVGGFAGGSHRRAPPNGVRGQRPQSWALVSGRTRTRIARERIHAQPAGHCRAADPGVRSEARASHSPRLPPPSTCSSGRRRPPTAS